MLQIAPSGGNHLELASAASVLDLAAAVQADPWSGLDQLGQGTPTTQQTASAADNGVRDAVIAALVVLLLDNLSMPDFGPYAVKLLGEMGIPALATLAAVYVVFQDGRKLVEIPAVPDGAVAWQQRTAVVRTAAYIIAAAVRVAKGGSIDAERRYFAQQQAAEQARQLAAARIDVVAAIHGPLVGWYSMRDAKTTPECRAADGQNFYAGRPPAIGYPGTLHGGTCRCTPGPPHDGGSVLAAV